MAHTPGPWEYVLDDDGVTAGVTFIIRMGSHLDGENGYEPQHRIEYGASSFEESPEQFGEAEANTKLIAAAPDLLAVAKSLDDFQRNYEEKAWDTMPGNQHYAGLLMAIVVSARAAIAKAEGR